VATVEVAAAEGVAVEVAATSPLPLSPSIAPACCSVGCPLGDPPDRCAAFPPATGAAAMPASTRNMPATGCWGVAVDRVGSGAEIPSRSSHGRPLVQMVVSFDTLVGYERYGRPISVIARSISARSVRALTGRPPGSCTVTGRPRQQWP